MLRRAALNRKVRYLTPNLSVSSGRSRCPVNYYIPPLGSIKVLVLKQRMFWAHLYNWIWEPARERECRERSPDMITAAMTRPLTGDEPRTFVEFVRRVLGF